MSNVLSFPTPPRAAEGGASWWTIHLSRLTARLAFALNRVGVPGFVAPTVIEDALTGQRLEVSVDPYFTRISVSGRDYYFDRFTGRLDGKGMACR